MMDYADYYDIAYEMQRVRTTCSDCPYHKYVDDMKFFCTDIQDYYPAAKQWDSIAERGCHPELDVNEWE